MTWFSPIVHHVRSASEEEDEEEEEEGEEEEEEVADVNNGLPGLGLKLTLSLGTSPIVAFHAPLAARGYNNDNRLLGRDLAWPFPSLGLTGFSDASG